MEDYRSTLIEWLQKRPNDLAIKYSVDIEERAKDIIHKLTDAECASFYLAIMAERFNK